MGIEIERKYLVTGTPWVLYDNVKVTTIKQGYMSRAKRHTIRIRIADSVAWITIKGPTTGCSRAEFEYEVPYEDGLELIKMCDGGVVDKTRYIVTDDYGQVWDIDEFHGINEGLVVAEIEMTTPNQQIALPSWVELEVTSDLQYTNSNLLKKKPIR